ncbi:MAG: PKD-like domain-containing protein [Bacteroidota bacterium]
MNSNSNFKNENWMYKCMSLVLFICFFSGHSLKAQPEISSYDIGICKNSTLLIKGTKLGSIRSVLIGGTVLVENSLEFNLSSTELRVKLFQAPSLNEGLQNFSVIYTTQDSEGNNVNRTLPIGNINIIEPIDIEIDAPPVVCKGETITVSASSEAVTYRWQDNSTEKNITATINSNQFFGLTVTDNNGCVAATQKLIIANEKPLAIISANTNDAICAGDTIKLNASLNDQYLWSDGSTGSSLSITPEQSTAVELIVMDANGCSDTTDIDIMVNPKPQIQLSGSTDICSGNSTTIVATGGQTYFWPELGSSSNTITVSPSRTGAFTLRATSSEGCQADTVINITVGSSPQFQIQGDDKLCSGETSTLSVPFNGNWSYQWSSAANNSVLSQVSIQPQSQTTYSVEVKDKNSNCAVEQSITVDVFDKPEVEIVGDDKACQGNEVQLTAQTTSQDVSFEWSTGQQDEQVSLALNQETEVEVVVTDNISGCQAEDTRTIQVIPQPNGEIEGNKAICFGETTTLTGKGGTIYDWAIGSDNPSVEVSPVRTTNYTLLVSNAQGCTDTVMAEVTVDQKPELNVSTNQVEICENESFAINLSSPNTVGNMQFSWTVSGDSNIKGASEGSGRLIAQNLFNDAGFPGTITYRVVAEIGGCASDMEQVQVVVNPRPVITIDGGTDICDSTRVDLFLNSDVLSTQFEWVASNGYNGSGGDGPNGSIIDDILFSANRSQMVQSMTYTINAKSAIGCNASQKKVEVFIYPRPQLRLNNDPFLRLLDGEVAEVTLSSPSSQAKFSWEPIGVEGRVEGQIAGEGSKFKQTLTLTDKRSWAKVFYNAYAYTGTRSGSLCMGDQALITLQVIPDVIGEAVFIPNVFSPNGDGVNDNWGISYAQFINPEEYSITVISRNGGVVLPEMNLDQAAAWTADGLPGGSYIYILKGPDLDYKAALTIQK